MSRILDIIRLIKDLQDNDWKVSSLAKKYKVSTRSIYRRIKILKAAGFEVKKSGTSTFTIDI